MDGRTDGDGKEGLKLLTIVCHPWSEMRGCAARGGGIDIVAVLHEREKRFYTLNGADKLYHMAFHVLLCVLSFCFLNIQLI
jgi:hypothetical protein